MSLLKKALEYRKDFLKKSNSIKINPNLSLLKKALSYLQSEVNIENNESIIDSDYQKKEDSNSLILELDKENNTENNNKYFDLINKVADELSALSIERDTGDTFFSILKNNFYFEKAIILLYSLEKEKFVYWRGSNISEETKNKIAFDLEYRGIYKQLVINKSLLLTKEKNLDIFSELLSSDDINLSDFIFLSPFVFSGHVIGILVLLSLSNDFVLSQDYCEAIRIIGRLNGALLYNIYQHERLSGLHMEDNVIDETDRQDIDFLSENNEDDSLIKFKNFIKNMLDKKIEKFCLLHLELKNDFTDVNFDIINFYGDIQFIVMNVVGTNAFVELLEDMEIYIALPDSTVEYARKIADEIIGNIKNIFSEITTEFNPEFSFKIVSYPDSSTDLVELLSLL